MDSMHFSSMTDLQFNTILAVLFVLFAAPAAMAAYFAIELIKIEILQEEERETNSND